MAYELLLPSLPDDVSLNCLIPKLASSAFTRLRLASRSLHDSQLLWSGVRYMDLWVARWARASGTDWSVYAVGPHAPFLTNLRSLRVYGADCTDPIQWDLAGRVFDQVTLCDLCAIQWDVLGRLDVLQTICSRAPGLTSLTIRCQFFSWLSVHALLTSLDLPKLETVTVEARPIDQVEQLAFPRASHFPRLRKLESTSYQLLATLAWMSSTRRKMFEWSLADTYPSSPAILSRVLKAGFSLAKCDPVWLRSTVMDWKANLSFIGAIIQSKKFPISQAAKLCNNMLSGIRGVCRPALTESGASKRSVVWEKVEAEVKEKLGNAAYVIDYVAFRVALLCHYWDNCKEKKAGALAQKRTFVVDSLRKLCENPEERSTAEIVLAIHCADGGELLPEVCKGNYDWLESVKQHQDWWTAICTRGSYSFQKIEYANIQRELWPYLREVAAARGVAFLTAEPALHGALQAAEPNRLCRDWLREYGLCQ